jgi:UDP-N-acetylmuramyl tripeptide synthase
MPLTFHGAAIYNIANISAAVLAAVALGISPAAIAGELKKFGSSRHDNAGRLEHWSLGDVTVLLDYAHNPGGLAMLLATSRSVLSTQDLRRSARGRLGLLLGQAGNRSDHAIAEIASTAASFAPDLIVLKEIASMLRGRSVGEVPALLKAALLAAGYPEPCIDVQTDELDAARVLLRWARPGDVLVLPIHQMQVRKELTAMLDRLERHQPIAGSPQPLDQPVNLGIGL